MVLLRHTQKLKKKEPELAPCQREIGKSKIKSSTNYANTIDRMPITI